MCGKFQVGVDMPECDHDFDNPVWKGRACCLCPKCGEDIFMHLLLMYEADDQEKEMEATK